jgi:hypothetical protein
VSALVNSASVIALATIDYQVTNGLQWYACLVRLQWLFILQGWVDQWERTRWRTPHSNLLTIGNVVRYIQPRRIALG